MKRFVITAALLACAAIAQGQGLPPGKWWQRPAIVQELQLTNDQQNRLDEIFRGAASDLIDARGTVEKLQISIRGELEKPQVRKTEILRLATQLSDARGKLFERELVMLLDMRTVLNEQQWAKMRRVLDRMQENHQERRQGQPPPPRGRRP
jgi:Spy/CpxP family protein refolding chaperone